MTGELVRVVVEIPVGGGTRRRPESESSTLEPYPRPDRVPALAFAAYGSVPGTLNPADECAADAWLLGAGELVVGEAVEARVLALRVRGDGDHKLLVSVAGGPSSLADVAPARLTALAAGTEAAPRPQERWADAGEAIAWLDGLRVEGVAV